MTDRAASATASATAASATAASATASATALPATTVSTTAVETTPPADDDTAAPAVNLARFAGMASTLSQSSQSSAQVRDVSAW